MRWEEMQLYARAAHPKVGLMISTLSAEHDLERISGFLEQRRLQVMSQMNEQTKQAASEWSIAREEGGLAILDFS